MKPSKNPLYRQKLGKIGENIACSYLSSKGYSIIGRNYKVGYGELDIICIKDNSLIFVEVKTRVGQAYGIPEEEVTPRKLAEVVRTAEYYKLCHPHSPDSLRIDVVAIELSDTEELIDLRHHENVTL